MWVKKAFAELLGTFCLVLAGTGAAIASSALGAPDHTGVALTFGLVVMVMIFILGPLSGAHINPAVTLAFAIAGQHPWSKVPLYLVAQFSGALLASGILWLTYPSSDTLGATLPAVPVGAAFVLEGLLTLILMFVILRTATWGKEAGFVAAIAVGGTVALEALFAGPITGASMNPARSLGPALVSGHLEHLWLYLTAPTLGALLAVPLCCALDDAEGSCCGACACRPAA